MNYSDEDQWVLLRIDPYYSVLLKSAHWWACRDKINNSYFYSATKCCCEQRLNNASSVRIALNFHNLCGKIVATENGSIDPNQSNSWIWRISTTLASLPFKMVNYSAIECAIKCAVKSFALSQWSIIDMDQSDTFYWWSKNTFLAFFSLVFLACFFCLNDCIE